MLGKKLLNSAGSFVGGLSFILFSALLFFLPASSVQAQTFTTIMVTTSSCVTPGQSIAVTAVFGPTNAQFQTDDFSVGFGNASTLLWPGGCTAAYNTGSLATTAPVTAVQSVTVPATVTGNWTTVDVVGIENSTYLCGGRTIIGSASVSLCSSQPTNTFTPTRTRTPTPNFTSTPTRTSTPRSGGTPTFTPVSIGATNVPPVQRVVLSNAVTNTVGGCSPTPTPTRTFTSTATATLTATATASFTASFTTTSTNTNTSTSTSTSTSTPTTTSTATSTSTSTSTDTFTSTSTLTPTPTNTATSTSTSTSTATATNTRTATTTVTSTNTATITNTATATNTPIFTYTNTSTPTITNTATATNTSTATFTATNTRTATNTFTATNSWTDTNTFTSTFTPTNTFTSTNTFTPTNTWTDTKTFTATFTPTDTFTATNTWTDTKTFTSTFTPTDTFTATNTRTFTKTPTSTNTATNTHTFTPTFTSTNTFTLTNTRTFTNTPTSTHTPTDTHTFTPSFTSTNTHTFTNTFTPTFTPTFTNTATATYSPTVTPTGTPDVEISKNASESNAKTGDAIVYTITLVVTGGRANNVQISDVLPDHLIYDGAGPVPAGGTYAWNLSTKTMAWGWASLDPGTYTVTYQGTVDTYMMEGTLLVNKADLTYEGLTGLKEATSSVSMARIYTVQVAIYNEAGELVKKIWVQQLSQEINGFDIAATPTITSLNGKIYVVYNGVEIATWDGTGQNGDPVSNGQYYVKVDNINSYGVDDSVSKMVLVNRSIAKVQVNIYNEAGEIVRHLYSFADDPGNLSLLDVSLSASIIQPSETTGAESTVAITSSNGMTIIWDGRSDSGNIVTNGHYLVEVHYTDGKGGDEVVTRGIVVESANEPLTNGNVFAGPNILKNGVNATTVQVHSSLNYTLTARLYNTVGELVKQAVTGPASTNQVPLNVSGLASGLYFVVVDLTNPEGAIAGHQVTQIVILR